MKRIFDFTRRIHSLKRNKDIFKHSTGNIIAFILFLFGVFIAARMFNISLRFVVHFSNQDLKTYTSTGILLFIVSTAVLAVIHEQVRRKVVLCNYRKSEEKYQQVVNSIGEVLFQTDINGKWTLLNSAWTEITGFTVEESIGKSFLEFVYIWDRKQNIELFNPLVKGSKDECRHEVRYINKSGNTCWIEVYARPTLSVEGRIIGTSGILKDITQRKLIELELNKKDKLLNGIAQSANILLHTINHKTALDDALEVLGRVTNIDLIYVFKNESYEETGKKGLLTQGFWAKHNINFVGEDGRTTRITWSDVGTLRWYKTLSKGDVFSGLVRDFPIEEQEYFKHFGVLSVLIMPIFIDGRFWGIIGFENHAEEYEWTGVEKNILMVAAGNIGGLFKRVQAEEVLKKAMQDDFKQIVQNLQNVVFKIVKNKNEGFEFSFIEGRYGEKIGLNTSNVSGKNFYDIFNFNVARYLSENCERAFEGNITNIDLVIARTTFYVTLTPIYKGEQVSELVGSAIDITSQKKAEEKIKSLAYYDSLTGLPNRSLFSEKLRSTIDEAKQENKLLAILFLDFDRFKVINDTLGHASGDLLLKQIGERLKTVTGKDEIVSRMGGDEFIILIPKVNSLPEIESFAQKVLDIFGEPINIGAHELFITTSIGISIYPQNGTEQEELIKNADTAMYRAKAKGGNNYEFYVTTMNEKALDRLELENDLRKAVDKNELFLMYQPKVELDSGNIIGAEALVRWKHGTRGIVSPADFIPLAEETGLIIKIGEWVLKTACLQAKVWCENGYGDIRISVNISPQQFLRGNLVQVVGNAVKESGINGSCIDLEITESCLMENSERNMEIVKRLKGIGVDISVDDFGKGFSSLSYLKQFDVDVLKIDSSFVKDIPRDLNDMAITTAIISMAHDLNLRVVAEGVETEEQLKFLLSKKCDEMQGYYFSKPLRSEEFEEMLKKKKSLYTENIYI